MPALSPKAPVVLAWTNTMINGHGGVRVFGKRCYTLAVYRSTTDNSLFHVWHLGTGQKFLALNTEEDAVKVSETLLVEASTELGTISTEKLVVSLRQRKWIEPWVRAMTVDNVWLDPTPFKVAAYAKPKS